MATGGPIDKLDLRIPGGTKLMRELERELLTDNPPYPYRSPNFNRIAVCGTKYYQCFHDLRRYGLSSTVHLGNRLNGNHKLEIVRSSTMRWSEVFSQIRGVLDVDPMEFQIIRI